MNPIGGLTLGVRGDKRTMSLPPRPLLGLRPQAPACCQTELGTLGSELAALMVEASPLDFIWVAGRLSETAIQVNKVLQAPGQQFVHMSRTTPARAGN